MRVLKWVTIRIVIMVVLCALPMLEAYGINNTRLEFGFPFATVRLRLVYGGVGIQQTQVFFEWPQEGLFLNPIVWLSVSAALQWVVRFLVGAEAPLWKKEAFRTLALSWLLLLVMLTVTRFVGAADFLLALWDEASAKVILGVVFLLLVPAFSLAISLALLRTVAQRLRLLVAAGLVAVVGLALYVGYVSEGMADFLVRPLLR